MSEQLLKTKFYIPPARSDLVPRQRLLRRLDEGLRPGHRLTLVSAPAGFGKTTLLSAWVHHVEAPASWLSLDEDDNDLTRFLNYLGAALARAAPDLAVPPAGGPTAYCEGLLAPLINQLAELNAPLVLVLDDYHLIVNPVIDEALEFLVDNAPPTLDDGSTRLSGELPDQATLHGVLAKIRDLSLTLIAVQLVEALPPQR